MILTASLTSIEIRTKKREVKRGEKGTPSVSRRQEGREEGGVGTAIRDLEKERNGGRSQERTERH